MESKQEQKNKRIAVATSIGVHMALLVVLMFTVAWRAPNPPLPEYGIELNFGMDMQGSGEVQPEEPVGDNADQQDEGSSDPEPDEAKEATPAEPDVVTKQESPVVVEKKEEVKPAEKPEPKQEEKKVEPVKPKEEVKTVYKPTTDNKTTVAKEGKTGSQGDDQGKTGDKGNPQGSLDAKALYGKQGGGDGGPSVELSGFKWGEIKVKDVPDDATGKYVFEIKVNREGQIESIKPLLRGTSLEAEEILKSVIEKIEFTATGSNLPELSTGKITFVIRSR